MLNWPVGGEALGERERRAAPVLMAGVPAVAITLCLFLSSLSLSQEVSLQRLRTKSGAKEGPFSSPQRLVPSLLLSRLSRESRGLTGKRVAALKQCATYRRGFAAEVRLGHPGPISSWRGVTVGSGAAHP